METFEIKNLMNPFFPVKEAYSNVRRNIRYLDKDMKIIGISGYDKNIDTSLVSINLAMTFAQEGKKVILVDSYPCKLSLYEKTKSNNIPSKLGLIDYLTGLNSEKEVTYETDVENLSIILSGPKSANREELLNNEKFEYLLQKLTEMYASVIVALPPLNLFSDCLGAYKTCEGIVMVVKANTASLQTLGNYRSQLEKMRCNVLGAALLQKQKLKKK